MSFLETLAEKLEYHVTSRGSANTELSTDSLAIAPEFMAELPVFENELFVVAGGLGISYENFDRKYGTAASLLLDGRMKMGVFSEGVRVGQRWTFAEDGAYLEYFVQGYIRAELPPLALGTGINQAILVGGGGSFLVIERNYNGIGSALEAFLSYAISAE